MFRFTIRDVILLTAIVALALGWSIDRSRLAKLNADLTMQRNRLADTKAQLVAQREALQRMMQQPGSAPSESK